MQKEYDLTQLKVKRRGLLADLPPNDSPSSTAEDWNDAFVSHSAAELSTEATCRKRGTNILSAKEQVAIGFDAEVLAYFRATGKGWQARMNDALKEWLKEHAV